MHHIQLYENWLLYRINCFYASVQIKNSERSTLCKHHVTYSVDDFFFSLRQANRFQIISCFYRPQIIVLALSSDNKLTAPKLQTVPRQSSARLMTTIRQTTCRMQTMDRSVACWSSNARRTDVVVGFQRQSRLVLKGDNANK